MLFIEACESLGLTKKSETLMWQKVRFAQLNVQQRYFTSILKCLPDEGGSLTLKNMIYNERGSDITSFGSVRDLVTNELKKIIRQKKRFRDAFEEEVRSYLGLENKMRISFNLLIFEGDEFCNINDNVLLFADELKEDLPYYIANDLVCLKRIIEVDRVNKFLAIDCSSIQDSWNKVLSVMSDSTLFYNELDLVLNQDIDSMSLFRQDLDAERRRRRNVMKQCG